MDFDEIKKDLDDYMELVEAKLKPPLKPCPFCGGEAEVVHVKMLYVPKFHEFRVACSKCLGQIAKTEKTKEKAIAKWNKRYEPPTPGSAIVPAGNARLAKKVLPYG